MIKKERDSQTCNKYTIPLKEVLKIISMITAMRKLKVHPIYSKILDNNKEVKKNIMKLNNSSASGLDKTSAEMIKYGPTELHSIIIKVLNKCIQDNIDIQMGFGLLNVIKKSNKPKGPVKHLRPLTLLPLRI